MVWLAGLVACRHGFRIQCVAPLGAEWVRVNRCAVVAGRNETLRGDGTRTKILRRLRPQLVPESQPILAALLRHLRPRPGFGQVHVATPAALERSPARDRESPSSWAIVLMSSSMLRMRRGAPAASRCRVQQLAVVKRVPSRRDWIDSPSQRPRRCSVALICSTGSKNSVFSTSALLLPSTWLLSQPYISSAPWLQYSMRS